MQRLNGRLTFCRIVLNYFETVENKLSHSELGLLSHVLKILTLIKIKKIFIFLFSMRNGQNHMGVTFIYVYRIYTNINIWSKCQVLR